MHLIVLCPVYNDWECVAPLLRDVDQALSAAGATGELLLVDDGSTDERAGIRSLPTVLASTGQGMKAIQKVRVLELARNLGHQGAIVLGLNHVSTWSGFDGVLVMDVDGEDLASEIPRLMDEFKKPGTRSAIFAKRSRRAESIRFRFFYWLYQRAYRVLVGSPIFVGNYCLLPFGMLPRLLLISELWQHYPSALIKAKMPWRSIDTARGKRYHGESRMNFHSLVLHGLSSISVYSDWVGIRALFFTGWASLGVLIFIACVIGIRLFTDLAIPGWASNLVLLSLIILVQMVIGSMLLALIVLGRKRSIALTPARDFQQFILQEHPVWPAQG